MAGVLIYYTFYALWSVVRICASFPVLTIIGLITLFTLNSCSREGNWFATDVPAMIAEGGPSVKKYAGSPDKCSNLSGMVVCQYDNMTVTTVGDKVTRIDYKRINGEPFNNNEEFHKRVLGMLELPYSDPVRDTLDEIAWYVPGIGAVVATSDDKLNLKEVIVYVEPK